MSEAFQWVVGVAAVVACLSVLVQAGILYAMYRVAMEAQKAGTELAPKVGPLIDRFDTFFVASSKVLEENSGKIANITEETLAVVKATRQQVERIGELIDDVNGRAKARIAQIDHAVESTVEQVEHASETVKSAVLKPVKEVNGLVAGVKAAISTYAQGGNRNSPEHATQDEEMFI
ncbi:MAG: hypothetical protein ACLP59_32995 [Bryobacteraceae bacterium]